MALVLAGCGSTVELDGGSALVDGASDSTSAAAPEPTEVPEPAAEPEPEPISSTEPTAEPQPEPTEVPEPTAEAEPEPTDVPEATPVPPVLVPVGETPELRVAPFDVIGLEPGRFSTENDEILIDAGATTTIVLDGDDPVWFGLLDGYPTFIDLPTIAPVVIDRLAFGFSTLAACPGSVVVASLTEPDELIAYDLAAGSTRWTTPGEGQISCGDAGTVTVQSDFAITAFDLRDGSERWSMEIQPDDPLRTTPTQAIVGTYDDLRGIDLETGDIIWSSGDSGSAVVQIASGYVVADFDLDDGNVVVAPSGAILASVDAEIRRDDLVVAVTGEGQIIGIDVSEFDDRLFDLDEVEQGEVVELYAGATDGRIWAAVADGQEGATVGLVDGDLNVVAQSTMEAPIFDWLAIGDVFVSFDSGEATIAGPAEQ
ncbi:MAG: PQQ-binding-like beta-propeller repeat protein [Actinomycetota bacterium]